MKKGFTLIELMVVILIIAILSGIVMAQFSVAKAKSRDGKRVADIAQIQLAIQLYFDRCNQYPRASATGLLATVEITSGGIADGCPSGVTLGTFLNQLPTPPSGGVTDATNTYTYRYIVHTTGTVRDDYYLFTRLETASAAKNDDVDGTIPSSLTGWSTTEQINLNDDADPYMYGVRAK